MCLILKQLRVAETGKYEMQTAALAVLGNGIPHSRCCLDPLHTQCVFLVASILFAAMCRVKWAYECFTELHDLPDMARHACSVWGRTTEAGPWFGIATSPRQLSTRTPSHIIIRHPYTLELFIVLSFITF